MIVARYLLDLKDRDSIIPMPEGARPLAVGTMYGIPYLWALVNPKRPVTDRRLLIVATDSDFDSHRVSYVGTFLLLGDVHHVFDRGESA